MKRSGVALAVSVYLLGATTGVRADHLSALPAAAPEALAPIPELDLSGAEPRAREAVLGARKNVEALLEDPATPVKDLAEAYGRLGAYYHVYNIRTGAEAGYLNAIRLDPAAYRWHHLLAYLAYSSGRYDEAMSLFAEARHVDPNNGALDLYEGDTLLGLNRVAEAEPLLRKAMARPELEASAAFRLGQIELQRRNFDEAIRLFELALDKDPAGDAAYFPLAQALRGAGRMEEAKAALAKRGKEATHIGDPIVEQLNSLDQGSRPLYVSGLAAARQGDYGAAAEAFGKGLENDRDNYRARATYARALYLSGHPVEGRAELERVEAVAPEEDPLATFLLGVLDNAAGDDEAARERFAIVLERSPSHSGALYFTGLLDFAAGDYVHAAERLEAAVTAEPGNYFAQVLALVARHRLGEEPRDPVEVLNALVDSAPNQLLPRYALVRLLAADEDPEVRDPDRALAMAEALTQQQPIPPVSEALGLALAVKGDFDGAEQALETAKSGYFFAGRFDEIGRMDEQLARVRNGELPAAAWPEDDFVLRAPNINPRGPFLEYPAARAY